MKDFKEIIGLIFLLFTLATLFPAISVQFFNTITLGIILGLSAALIALIIWILSENDFFENSQDNFFS